MIDSGWVGPSGVGEKVTWVPISLGLAECYSSLGGMAAIEMTMLQQTAYRRASFPVYRCLVLICLFLFGSACV